MKYIVSEIQHLSNDVVAAPSYAFDDEFSANAKYHQILAVAAVSDVPVHAATMVTEYGEFIKGEYFAHEAES